MTTAFVRLPPFEAEASEQGAAGDATAAAPVPWLVRGDRGETLARGESLRGLAMALRAPEQGTDARAGDTSLVALVPADQVLALPVAIPGRSVAEMRRATPFAVEEHLTEDIESMHVATGPLVRGAEVMCLAVPRSAVAGWLEALAEHGLAPRFLTADAMALPSAQEAIAVLHEGERALVRCGDRLAGVDAAMLPVVLEGLCERPEGGAPPSLLEVNGAVRPVELGALSLAECQRRDLPALDFLADSFAGGTDAVNLLQGEFAPQRSTWANLPRWKPLAALAAAGLLVWLSAMAIEGWWANRQANALREQAVALYRDIYGTEHVVGNPANRMRSQLGGSPQGGPGGRALIGHLGAGLTSSVAEYELRTLSYADGRGLAADVTVPSYDALDRLEQHLTDKGVQLTIASAEQEDGRVRARLRVGAGS